MILSTPERSIDGLVVKVRNDLLMLYQLDPERSIDALQVGYSENRDWEGSNPGR